MPRIAKGRQSGERTVRNLPASESGYGVRYIAKSGAEYCVSHCPEKDRFTLWRVTDGGYVRIQTAPTPQELYALAK